MDKLLTVFFILLLFFIPILLKQSPQITKEVEEAEVEAELCPVEIIVTGMDKPIPLEEYVVGVVAAEMPVAFSE